MGSPLRFFSGTGINLFLQAAFFVSGVGSLLRAQRELVLRLARDALLLTVKFGGVRHVETAIGVEQRDHERIFQLATRGQAQSRRARE